MKHPKTIQSRDEAEKQFGRPRGYLRIRSPVPWDVVGDGVQNIVDGTGQPLIEDSEDAKSPDLYWRNKDDAQRIALCVNACKHLPDTYLLWLHDNERFLVASSLKSASASIEQLNGLAKGVSSNSKENEDDA